MLILCQCEWDFRCNTVEVKLRFSEFFSLPADTVKRNFWERNGDIHHWAVHVRSITYPSQEIANDCTQGDLQNLQAGPSINMCHISFDTLCTATGDVISCRVHASTQLQSHGMRRTTCHSDPIALPTRIIDMKVIHRRIAPDLIALL